jgi:hypothetical protein
MEPSMNQITQIVAARMKENGLEYTITNRVKLLAGLANEVAEMEDLEPLDRIRIALEISVEIVRLRTEKELFNL